MQSVYTLRLYIEKKRKAMIEAANHYGLCSEITVKHSQELDELLNQYGNSLETPRKTIVNQNKKSLKYFFSNY